MYHSGNQLVDPYLIFEKARLHPGMRVADFGCGRTGHIVFPAAMIIGEHGVVYAIDILKDVLQEIHKRAALQNMLQIQTIWADIEKKQSVTIPERTLDLVFIVNTLSQVKNRDMVLSEAERLLKDKARIVLVDWVNRNIPIAPSPEEMIQFSQLKHWAKEHGFAVQEEFPVGRYHGGIVLFKG